MKFAERITVFAAMKLGSLTLSVLPGLSGSYRLAVGCDDDAGRDRRLAADFTLRFESAGVNTFEGRRVWAHDKSNPNASHKDVTVRKDEAPS
jgi:hypothetical protein